MQSLESKSETADENVVVSQSESEIGGVKADKVTVDVVESSIESSGEISLSKGNDSKELLLNEKKNTLDEENVVKLHMITHQNSFHHARAQRRKPGAGNENDGNTTYYQNIIDDSLQDSEQILVLIQRDTLDQYRMFQIIEPYLQEPLLLSSQLLCQLDPPTQQVLLHNYYEIAGNILRELICRKLDMKKRTVERMFRELHSRFRIPLRSLRRQFGNLRRIADCAIEYPFFRDADDVCAFVRSTFLLSHDRAHTYSCALFILHHRFRLKPSNIARPYVARRFEAILWKDLHFCADVMITHFSNNGRLGARGAKELLRRARVRVDSGATENAMKTDDNEKGDNTKAICGSAEDEGEHAFAIRSAVIVSLRTFRIAVGTNRVLNDYVREAMKRYGKMFPKVVQDALPRIGSTGKLKSLDENSFGSGGNGGEESSSNSIEDEFDQEKRQSVRMGKRLPNVLRGLVRIAGVLCENLPNFFDEMIVSLVDPLLAKENWAAALGKSDRNDQNVVIPKDIKNIFDSLTHSTVLEVVPTSSEVKEAWCDFLHVIQVLLLRIMSTQVECKDYIKAERSGAKVVKKTVVKKNIYHVPKQQQELRAMTVKKKNKKTKSKSKSQTKSKQGVGLEQLRLQLDAAVSAGDFLRAHDLQQRMKMIENQ
eukprot:g2487.t1